MAKPSTNTKTTAETTSPKTVKPRKKTDFAQMGEQATQAASGINRSPLLEMLQTEEQRQQQTMPVSHIQPRPEGDTRPLHPKHLLALAESIGDWGLLEPIVVDKEGVLLAGGHRLAAYKLLSTPIADRVAKLHELCPDSIKHSDEIRAVLDVLSNEDVSRFENIPVRVLPFHAKEEKDRALAIETAENTQRRDYTSKEVLGIYEQLLSVGYTDREGRPKTGEKQAKPALATIIGKSLRTVRRLLNKKEEQANAESLHLKHFQMAGKRFMSARDALRTTLENLPGTDEVKNLLDALNKLSHVGKKIKEVEDAFASEKDAILMPSLSGDQMNDDDLEN